MLQNIIDLVEALVDKYDERNPMKLCKHLDIELIPYNFTKNFKGYQVEIDNVKIIIYNSNLSDILKKFVCAHELAHFILHEDLSDSIVRKFNVSDLTAKPELHSNYFASELLIADDEVLFELKNSNNYFDIASSIGVIPEILDFKIRLMQYKGYDLPDFLNISGDFLEKYVDVNMFEPA